MEREEEGSDGRRRYENEGGRRVLRWGRRNGLMVVSSRRRRWFVRESRRKPWRSRGGEKGSGEREGEGGRRRAPERDVGWEGVFIYIYIYLWKLPLTTLLFILNYISSPKVCIYYFYSLFLSYYFLGFKNICSWKFIAPINSFYYTYLNPKLSEI